MEQLIIPSTLKVGYQKRSDTYTQKLAYVIYIDTKGKLRKETSWQGWRDQKIDPDDYANVPTEGFILNRNVGGVRYSSWNWNNRREKVRVYDPRGFEFEITIENMLYILQECTSTKGKGLEGQFVYAWAGPELILLPVDTVEYRKSVEFTSIQTNKLTKNDIVPGCSYTMKDQKVFTYLGRLDKFEKTTVFDEPKADYYLDSNGRRQHYQQYRKQHTGVLAKKYHVFVNEDGDYHYESGFTNIAIRNTETPEPNFAELLNAYLDSKWGSAPVEIVYEKYDINFNKCKESYSQRTFLVGTLFQKFPEGLVNINLKEHFNTYDDYSPENSKGFRLFDCGSRIYNYENNEFSIRTMNNQIQEYLNAYYTKKQIQDMSFYEAFVVLERGSKIKLDSY